MIYVDDKIRSVVKKEMIVQTEVKALYKDLKEVEFTSDSFFTVFKF